MRTRRAPKAPRFALVKDKFKKKNSRFILSPYTHMYDYTGRRGATHKRAPRTALVSSVGAPRCKVRLGPRDV